MQNYEVLCSKCGHVNRFPEKPAYGSCKSCAKPLNVHQQGSGQPQVSKPVETEQAQ